MRTGKRFAAAAAAFLQAWLLLLLPLGVNCPALASPRKKPKAEQTDAAAAAALLGGTVFRDAGFALRGAEIVVTRAPEQGTGSAALDDGAGARKSKPGSWKAVSDARGEFLLRLPAGPARYTISVRAAGCKPQEKVIAFTADERLDQNFLLESVGSAK